MIFLLDSSHTLKYFIQVNICSHDSIEAPKDAKGKAVMNNLASTPGLEIPLVVIVLSSLILASSIFNKSYFR